MQPYRRGNRDTDYELSRVQDRLENWSDELDGENGVLNQWQIESIERKQLRRLLAGGLVWMAAMGGIPGVILILQLIHVIHLP